MGKSLKEKTVKGISWSLVDKIGVQGTKFLVGILLARLLSPEDFGLIGMITVFFTVANVFIQSGFGHAYVQKKDATNVDANTVFYTNFFISVVLYIILWLLAPLIAKFYEQPQLIELTRVMGFVVIINSFRIIQESQIKRNVNFKRKAIVSLIAIIIAGSISIITALKGLGVWSLVILQMGNMFLLTAGLWLSSRWKLSIKFSIESFKEMFSFGVWILGSGIIKTIFDNIYILTIGKFFPASQVGFYTKAKDFQRMFVNQIASAIGIVAFPVLSQLQEDKEKLQHSMRKFLTHTQVIIIPLMVTLIVVAKPLVILLIKDKWVPMIPYLQLLCIVGVLYPIHLINVQVLIAQGKSNLNFNLTIIKNGLRVLNILLMYRFGVIYIIIGEMVVSFIALFINTWYTQTLINYGFFKQFKDIGMLILGGVIAGMISYIFILINNLYWIQLFGGGLLSLGFFVLFQYIANREFYKEIIDLKIIFKKNKL
ncbi:MAG: lipopolysaccharide biosynthesis protein [bacterium]